MTGELPANLPQPARDRTARRAQPRTVTPMLATLTDRYFSSPDWLYERKLDGERVLARFDGDRARLLSRTGRDLTGSYPELAEAIAAQSATDLIVDGEVVAFEGNRTSFARLQRRMQLTDPDRARRTGVAVYFYLFDLLYVAGHDVTRLGLRDRKTLLRDAVRFAGPLRYTTHRNTHGERYLAEACRRGWEGVIAKRADSRYRAGRSTDWLKFKCVTEQELVIGGFTDPAGSRRGFGALLVGYYDGRHLRYAGKVGTGYDNATLDRLRRTLDDLATPDSPFDTDRPAGRGVHWVRPELVAEVGFTEWTTDGLLRHPRFLGLRRDKDPSTVVRERPM
ncbi:MAG: non-homologous end-joining DNA ligase [Actinocatenispora sp.]